MEQLVNYIQPELLILIPVMYIIGLGLKKTEKISNNLIPLYIGVISIVLASIYTFSVCDVTGYKEIATAVFTSITQGVLCGGASVYFNQLFKQTIQKTEE